MDSFEIKVIKALHSASVVKQNGRKVILAAQSFQNLKDTFWDGEYVVISPPVDIWLIPIFELK